MISNISKLLATISLLLLTVVCADVDVGRFDGCQKNSIPPNDETVGALKGSLEVSSNGAASYSIPINVVPGTADITPKLHITYNSQGKNDILGMGFSIQGLTSITRTSDNVFQNGEIHGVDFTDADRFELNGQQLVAVNGDYGQDGTEYRTYLGSQSKIISYGKSGNGPQKFKVWTKGGQVAEYGFTDDSSLKAVVTDSLDEVLDGQTVKTWALDKISDRSGNYLSISYLKTDATGELYPNEINYTANDVAGVKPYNKVKFTYEDRTDIRDIYHAGSLTKIQKRLSEIQVYSNTTLVYSYKINYEYSPNSFNSRITSIQKCNGNGNCVKPTTFDWQTNGAGWEAAPQYVPPAPIVNNAGDANPHGIDNGVRFVDLNGNGVLDMVQYARWNPSSAPKGAWVNNGKGWESAPQYTPPAIIVDNMGTANPQGIDNGVRFIDITGNGIPDMVQYANWSPVGVKKGAWTNNGTGWVASSAHVPPAEIVNNAGDATPRGIDNGVRFADLTGNGLVDIVQNAKWMVSAPKGAWINSDGEWKVASEYVPPSAIIDNVGDPNPHGIDNGVRLIDLTGNGLADMVQYAYWNPNSVQQGAWINNKGWESSSEYALPVPIVNNAGDCNSYGIDNGVRFIDLTGNGVVDMVQNVYWNPNSAPKGAWINNGRGWKSTAQYVPPAEIINNEGDAEPHGIDNGVRFVDFTGSGIVGMVQHAHWMSGTPQGAWVNNGKGWEPISSYIPPAAIIDNATDPNPIGIDNGVRFIDLTGSGIVDMVQYVHWMEGIQKGAWLNKAKKKPDYLIGITNGFGEKTSIDYEPLSGTDVDVYSQERNADGSLISEYPDPQYSGPMYVVYQTASDAANNDPQTKAFSKQAISFPQSPYSTIHQDANESQHITTYHYIGARVNKLGRGFLGFHEVQTTDNTTGITRIATYSQDPDQHNINQPVSVINKASDGTIISNVENTWDLKTFGDGTVNNSYYLPYTKQSIKKAYDLVSGTLLSTVTTDSVLDDYANPTEIKITTQDSTGKYITDTKHVYQNDTDNWFIGQLMSVQVTKSAPNSSNITRESTFTYDTNGLLSSTTTQPNDSNFTVKKLFERDGFGNITKTTISGSNFVTRTSSVGYDDQGRFAISKTNALNQTSTRTIDQRFGKPLTTTDLNGLITSYQYDGWGRLVVATHPDQTQALASYQWQTGVVGIGMNEEPINAVYKKITHSSGSTTDTIYYDKLNRHAAKSTQGFDGTLIWNDTFYDNLGRVVQQAKSHFDNDTIYYTKFKYDPLGRLIETDKPDDTCIKVVYDGLKTTTINQLSQKAIKTTNAIGKIVQAVDNAGSVTSYQYDAYGNMTLLTDSKGNSSSITYDKMGRKIGINDPDKGIWNYQYDALSNLLSQTSVLAKQTTTIQYDLLDRMVSRKDSVGTSAWVYGTDKTKFNVGHLISENGVANVEIDVKGHVKVVEANAIDVLKARQNGLQSYSKAMTYDKYARPSTTTTTIDTKDYVTQVEYDDLGRVSRTTYPNGFAIQNAYTSLGYLSSIRDATGSSMVYWKISKMDALGKVTSAMFNDKFVVNKTYDPKTRFLINIKTTLGPTSVQDLTYTYDALGNVQTRVDAITNINETFNYNDGPDGTNLLNRLTDWNATGNVTQTAHYEYDELGNMTYQSGIGHYTYGGNAGPHAVGVITDDNGNIVGQFKYDDNGNQTGSILNGKTRDITYTSYEKPLAISSDIGTTNFYYNANRKQFVRIDHIQQAGQSVNSTLVSLGSYQEENSVIGKTSVTKNKIYVGPYTEVVFETTKNSTTGNVYGLLKDSLGSVTDIVDSNGATLQKYHFTPFGKRMSLGGSEPNDLITHKGFTGHQEVEVFGLIHMMGRIYDPVIARFLSADPTIQNPTNSQSLNRYSYCANNPVALTDPTGYTAVASSSGGGGSSGGDSSSGGSSGDATNTSKHASANKKSAKHAAGKAGSVLKAKQAAWYKAHAHSKHKSTVKTGSHGGSFSDALKSAQVSHASAAASGDVEGDVHAEGWQHTDAGTHSLAHGLVGGGFQVVAGGLFKNRFLSNAIMDATPIHSSAEQSHSLSAIAQRTDASAVVGSTVASKTGGNSDNGAKTSAFSGTFEEHVDYKQQVKEEHWKHSTRISTKHSQNKTPHVCTKDIKKSLLINTVPQHKHGAFVKFIFSYTGVPNNNKIDLELSRKGGLQDFKREGYKDAILDSAVHNDDLLTVLTKKSIIDVALDRYENNK